MIEQRIVALRVDLYDCVEKPPREYINPIEPANAINKAWIPQTMGDQIWVAWEFSTEKEKEDFEVSLPKDVYRWLDKKVIDHLAHYGWGVRDYNGFRVEVVK